MQECGNRPGRTFLKASEVAASLNVSPKTTYLWYDMGRIRGVKIRGSLRIYRDSMETIVAARKQS